MEEGLERKMEKPTKKSTPTRAAGAARTTRTLKAAATAGVRRTTTSTKPAKATKASAYLMESSTATAVLEAPHAPTHDEIARRAHLLYEQSGFAQGRDAEFWLEAERQLAEELNR
jgi:hypothetical protein